MQSQHPTTTRRAFLGQTALASAAMMTTRGWAADARRLPVAFLGAGHSHFKEKYRAIGESPDFKVIGVCEEDAEIRRQLPDTIRWLSFDELVGEAEVVVVESAVGNHATDARRALLAGKHVHVEKPPADTLAAFDELFEAAGQRQRILQIGYMWRYNPGLNTLIEAARSGWLGEVYLVRATMNTLASPEARRAWAGFRGGAMFEQGCHLVDAVVRLLGRPTTVTPFLQQLGQPSDTLADNTVAVLEYPRALAIITSAPRQPNAGPQRFFEILGTTGTGRLQPLEPPALTLDLAQAAGPYAAGRQEVKLPPYRRYVDDFVALAAAVRSGMPLPDSAATERVVQETVLRAGGML